MPSVAAIVSEVSKLLFCVAGVMVGVEIVGAASGPALNLLGLIVVGLSVIGGLVVMASWVYALTIEQFDGFDRQEAVAAMVADREAGIRARARLELLDELEAEASRAQAERELAEIRRELAEAEAENGAAEAGAAPGRPTSVPSTNAAIA